MASSHDPAPQQSSPQQPGGSTDQFVSANAPDTESLWARIRRHKVAEWTLAYVAFSYALLHGVEVVGEALEWPSAVPRFTLFALLLGTPIAATLAYYHGHRAQHRVSRIEISILAALLVVAGSALWILSRSAHDRALTAATALVGTTVGQGRPDFSPPQHSVAVLPFTNLSGDPQQDYFSDGMSEELINALSHIEALEVTARTSSFAFKARTSISERLPESSTSARSWSVVFDARAIRCGSRRSSSMR